MYNFDDFTFVRSHVATPYIRRHISSKSQSFVITCRCSYDNGADQGDILFNQDCPACHGMGEITLAGSREDYHSCTLCNGSGKDPDDTQQSYPCPVCQGSGLVKIQA